MPSDWIEQQAAWLGLPEECSSDSEKGAWLIRPPQQIWEGTIIIMLSLWALSHYSKLFRAQLRRQALEEAAAAPTGEAGAIMTTAATGEPSWIVTILDHVFKIMLSVSLATVFYHKWNGNKLAYLLQPCHVQHTLLLLIFSQPRGSQTGAILFAGYCHFLVGPFLGMVAADLECYTQRFELLNWGVQHALLLIVPLYFLVSQRFRVFSGGPIFGATFAFCVFWHWGVLAPFSILFGANINFMLCPPAGTPLGRLGRWYRVPTLVMCGLGAWILRYVVIEAFIRRCVVTKEQKLQQQQAKKNASRTLGQVEPRSPEAQVAYEAWTKEREAAKAEAGLRQRPQQAPTAIFQPRA